MAVIGGTLWLGATASLPRRFCVVGACAHVAVLPAYFFHWDRFASYVPRGGPLRMMIILHLAFIAIETFAVFAGGPDRQRTRAILSE
jgi:hypothetical protein